MSADVDAARRCGEMYASRGRMFDVVPLDCDRPARYRVDVGTPAPVYRCGIHVRWYRRNVPTAKVEVIR